MTAKEQIAQVMIDNPLSSLDSETFSPSWLDDNVRVARLEQFVIRAHGFAFDGTPNLYGDAKRNKIAQILDTHKDRLWDSTHVSPTADFSDDATNARLERIATMLTQIKEAE